ncbi:hypothetical protein OG298_45080 (plasmid) [Streptomyces sp. NBC_01005]|nr:hypothetical protein OG298_45080 [Streptomyces sp. NBC_01005]
MNAEEQQAHANAAAELQAALERNAEALRAAAEASEALAKLLGGQQ